MDIVNYTGDSVGEGRAYEEGSVPKEMKVHYFIKQIIRE